MPTYSYKCNKCEKDFDRIRSISDREDGGQCPSCGSDETKQTLTAPRNIKGSGEGWCGQRKGSMS